MIRDEQPAGPLSRFFETEYSPAIHDVLSSALRELDPAGECVRTCNFNLFDIVFDAKASSLTITDVLDDSDAGVEVVTMHAFAAALRRARSSMTA